MKKGPAIIKNDEAGRGRKSLASKKPACLASNADSRAKLKKYLL
jgi:hypothetical protein